VRVEVTTTRIRVSGDPGAAASGYT
jgi:hypothetical protein